jgi:hypothetical protein
MLAFGVWLATRGALPRASLVLSALGVVAAVAASFVVGRRGGAGAEHLPSIVAEAVCWLAGTTLAVAVAVQALRRDREEGVLALARARGIGAHAYALGRLGGLSVVLAVALGIPTLVAALGATSASHAAGSTLRSSLAALVYTAAFSATIGPVAMATLGARTRAGGYFTLLAVLVLPELVAPITSEILPAGWDELTSIPAALEAVRAAVETPMKHGEHLARAVVGLAGVVFVSLVVVGERLRNTEGTSPAPDGTPPAPPGRGQYLEVAR